MRRNFYFGSKCPSCGSEGTMRNSRTRNQGEKIIKAITWYELYRCRKCGWRGWRANIAIDKRKFKKIIIYILLMLITAFLVYNLLKMVI